MPTDGVSLLLYVGLLLPGFAFALMRVRHRPIESRSTFRETTTAVFISVICDGLLLTVVAVVALVVPPVGRGVADIAPNVPASVVAQPAVWTLGTVGFLLSATVLGAALGTERLHTVAVRGVGRTRVRAGSSWHAAFQEIVPSGTKHILVSAELLDGSWVQGVLSTWDRSSTDVADRALVLVGGLARRRADEPTFTAVVDASAIVVTDRNIRSLHVTHLDVSWPPPPAETGPPSPPSTP